MKGLKGPPTWILYSFCCNIIPLKYYSRNCLALEHAFQHSKRSSCLFLSIFLFEVCVSYYCT